MFMSIDLLILELNDEMYGKNIMICSMLLKGNLVR